MALKFQFIHAVKRGYNVLFTEMADTRTDSKFLISSPIPLGCIMVVYFLYVVFIGPKFMQNRQPRRLWKTFFFYNIFTVFVNLRIFHKGLLYWLFKYDSLCGPIERFKTEESIELADFVYLHFISKVIELLHTVILILSKKNHTTYPHIFRHTVLIGASWCCVKYYPGSHCAFVAFVDGTVNMIIHFIFLVTYEINYYDRYWTWKKRVIAIKVVHLQILFLHLLEQLTYGCDYPKIHLLIILPISFFVTNAYLNYDHEDKIDEFFRLMKAEEAPKKYKFPKST